MDKLVYIYYVLLAVALFWGAKIYKRGTWNDGFMSLSQTKALQGFAAICIMFHHISQKTCAFWLDPRVIKPGLEVFVDIGYLLVGIFFFCSGYGLLKSVRNKPNYIDNFIKKRILPVVIAFYSTGIIFLVVRFIMGERINVSQFIFYLTGLKLSNSYSWYAIALPIFYLGFYLGFKHCKKERNAILITCLFVFLYAFIGSCIEHSDFWLCGEWWYSSVHFFPLGILLAKYEKPILEKIKKHYWLTLILLLLSCFVFTFLTNFVKGSFDAHRNYLLGIIRRWAYLLPQMFASTAIVFIVFLLGLKIKIGNKFLAFMGTITLEFYLLHGLFVELFGFNFLNIARSVYYIRDVFLFTLAVFIPSVIFSVLLQKFDKQVLRVLTKQKKSFVDTTYNPEPIISVCGDDCAVCPRYTAKTKKQLKQVAEFWYKAGWRDHVITPEEIKCDGCSTHSACGCRFKILACTIEHSVSKCPECKNFPCDKVNATLESTEIMKEQCRATCKTKEEFSVFERAFYKKAENLGLKKN